MSSWKKTMQSTERKWYWKPGFGSGETRTDFPVRMLRDINSQLKRRDLKVVEARDAVPAPPAQVLQGITRAALQTASFYFCRIIPRNHESIE